MIPLEEANKILQGVSTMAFKQSSMYMDWFGGGRAIQVGMCLLCDSRDGREMVCCEAPFCPECLRDWWKAKRVQSTRKMEPLRCPWCDNLPYMAMDGRPLCIPVPPGTPNGIKDWKRLAKKGTRVCPHPELLNIPRPKVDKNPWRLTSTDSYFV